MNYRSTCPVSNLLDLLGDKWSILIVRDLFLGRNKFSEFLNSPEKISTNVLVDRLKKLRQFGIIDFIRKPDDRKIKIYFLTEKGLDLYSVIAEMAFWSKKHLELEFHPIAVKVFKEIEALGIDIHKQKTFEDYTNSQKKLKSA